jgi:hypothetical protein
MNFRNMLRLQLRTRGGVIETVGGIKKSHSLYSPAGSFWNLASEKLKILIKVALKHSTFLEAPKNVNKDSTP